MNLRESRSGLFVGLGIIALAAVLAWQTSLIPSEAAYAQVGPTVVPWLVTAMLAVLGVALIFETSGERDAAEEPRGALDHRPLMWVIAGLVINVTTITYLGFIIASTALFVCAARGFDSKSPLRDAAVGLAIAVVVYVGFDRGLGYEIGDGLIENLL